MAQGKMPTSVSLPRRNEYQIEINAAGFQPQTLAITKGINGWLWLNLLEPIGFVVDLVSGAAWKLEPALVNVSLVKSDDNAGGLSSHVEFRDKHGNLLFEHTQKLMPLAR